MAIPEHCSSSAAAATAAKKGKGPAASSSKLDPIDSSLFSLKNDEDGTLPAPLQDDFGEFLLDAAQWL